ncbi:MAG TPA: hypothetical protein VFM55_19090 [Micromonosporaceae bacterium]|nr:hypothetical protein [Micromonosporaceae bacterium]
MTGGEVVAIAAALGFALAYDRVLARRQRRWEESAGTRTVQEAQWPAEPPTARVRCAIHGEFHARVATIVIDLDVKPRIAHIPCPDCGESRDVPVSPAFAVWMVHHGAMRMDDLLRRAGVAS